MKVILDVDPGVDDAVAMGQILSRKDIELICITCVRGNTDVDQTTTNTLKVIEAFNRKDVKVFKGASSPILSCEKDALRFHGADGLADCIHDEPDMSPLQEEHAVLAINRLARQHFGEITLIALGPLTNIALAFRVNQNLSKELKELIIMGGNYKGLGNVTMAAEYNFHFDPIAARIVLEEFVCPKYLVTWELSKQHFLTLEDVSEYCGHDNTKSQFMHTLFRSKELLTNLCGFCDSVAVAVATNREIIKNSYFKYATVDTESSLTKGMVVISWNPQDEYKPDFKSPNVIIVDDINVELYRHLFLESVKYG